jgi:tetratricopeptide (TPR) repeat protein
LISFYLTSRSFHAQFFPPNCTKSSLGQKLITDLTSATLKDVPFLGDILEKEVPSIIEASAQEFQYHQSLKEVKRQEDPLGSLTRAFVDDLNYIVTLPIPTNVNRVRSWGKIARLFYSFAQHLPWFSGKQDRRMKILLFFDAFDHLAPETALWLLDPFLESNILSNIVLVIASHKSITQFTPDDPQQWQPYFYKNNIYSIQLKSLTKTETRSFLTAKGITDADRNEKVWNLSDGLPLYLSLLTSNPQGQVNPNADVIVNFLSWLPEVKQKLIKDASLFSRPFDLFDLSAFPYLPEDEDELQKLYFWLIEQPFVRLVEGRYIYHELARELFSSHLYHDDLAGYYTTRRTLVNHYASLLKTIREEWGKAAYRSPRWLELTLALAFQLLCLPDEISQIKGIEQILTASRPSVKKAEIVRVLHEISHDQSLNQQESDAYKTTEYLIRFIEANQQNQDFIATASYLLEKIVRDISFPKALRAKIYRVRGKAYESLKEYQLAIADYNWACDLTPDNSFIYVDRSLILFTLKKFQKALDEIDQAIRLSPESGNLYGIRGMCNFELKEYQCAVEDFDKAIKMKASRNVSSSTYYFQAAAYYYLKEYQQAIDALKCAIEIEPDYIEAYKRLARIYIQLDDYQNAIQIFYSIFELDPNFTDFYLQRGTAYVRLNDYQHAFTDLEYAHRQDPTDVRIFALLGEVYRIVGRYEDALTLFNNAITIDGNMMDSVCTEKGLVLSYLGRYSDSIECYEHGLKKSPSNFIYLYNIAVVMVRWKGFPDAQIYLDNARNSLENQMESDRYGAVLYGLGGLEALTGNEDQALIYLEQSLPLEREAIEWAHHDIAWLDLRSNERFKMLISN